jgi:hypothetical protein
MLASITPRGEQGTHVLRTRGERVPTHKGPGAPWRALNVRWNEPALEGSMARGFQAKRHPKAGTSSGVRLKTSVSW